MLKIGFTGTRGDKDQGGGMTDAQKKSLTKLLKSKTFDEFHHGDCIGSDQQAHDIVRNIRKEVKIIGHPPKYNKFRAYCEFDMEHKVHDYLNRNHYIVDDTDALVATPFDEETLRSGTWSTVRYARKLGKIVYIIKPDGKVIKE